MKIKFLKGNKVRFFQDFSLWEGVPSDVWFTVEKQDKDGMWLKAKGYGVIDGTGKNYGNGAIRVYFHDAKAIKCYISNSGDADVSKKQ